jgi:hypothetical protein
MSIRLRLIVFVGCCLTWPLSTIPLPTRREFGIAAHLQRTARADCIRNPFNHPLGIAGIGTFVAVVIETPEHKAVSESSEVMTKLTANSRIALCSSKNAVSISSARTMNRFP